jgi:uncharacterized protein YegL
MYTLKRFFHRAGYIEEEKAMTQNSLEAIEFVENPEPRCAVALVLDVSGSMSGPSIAELNAGLQEFDKDLKADPLASLRVEVGMVTFGGAVTTYDFVTADQFHPPMLAATGDTPMGQAVQKALTMLRERKDSYKANGVDYYRPWLFLITDGAPTDTWEPAAAQARQEEDQKGVSVYAIGVEGADMQTLSQFSSKRQPLKLKGLTFRELFQWLSKSLGAVALSNPGQQAPLPTVGWAEADT